MTRSAHSSSHWPIKSGNGLAVNSKPTNAACERKNASAGVQLEKMLLRDAINAGSTDMSVEYPIIAMRARS